MNDKAEQVKQLIREIVARELDKNIEQITDDASFIDDLGATSLDVVELILALEDEFDIEIPDEEAEKIVTFGDAMVFMESRLAEIETD